MRSITKHHTIGRKVLFDRNRASNPLVIGRQEADERHHEQTGIEQLRSVGLDERTYVRLVALLADLVTYCVANRAPAVNRTIETKGYDDFNGSMQRHPRHHFRMGELTAQPAYFPQPLIGLGPRSIRDV